MNAGNDAREYCPAIRHACVAGRRDPHVVREVALVRHGESVTSYNTSSPAGNEGSAFL